MISSDFKPYVLEILNFLKSVTIKYSWMADQTNVMLVSQGYDVDEYDPTSWKYYQNLVGNYHVSDTPMYVFSLDTLEKIPFTKDALQYHPRTVTSYRPGTTYFDNLCAEYPTQMELIKSILFPVDSIEAAIAAPNLTLLKWGEGYLEDAESSVLIADLVSFLAVYRERWYFSFLQVEDYFHPSNLGILEAKMAAYLLSRRHAYIRTPYVHSWHISNYLQSKGLDDYTDVLSRKKQLFLYQNWDYLKINSGKQSNLIILIQNLLADMGISLFGRRVLLESQTGEAACQLTPRFIPDNLLGSESKLVDEIQAESVLEMQQRLYAQGLTVSQTSESVTALTRKLGDTTRNNYLTKLLEIKPVQVDYRYQGLLDQFILDTLIKSITSGRYNTMVMITDPLTGSTHWMTTKEALALYDYSVRKAGGGEPDDLPTSYTYIATLKDKPDTPDPTFFYNGNTYYTKSILDTKAFLGYWSWPLAIKSSAEFSALLSEYWLLYLVKFQNMEYATAGVTKQAIRVCLKAAFRHNVREPFTLIPGFTTYAEWLSGNGNGFQDSVFANYDATTNPTTQYALFADGILNTLFTADSVLRQYGNFALSDNGYMRLRKLFEQLSSYTVRFLETNQNTQDYMYLGAFVFDDTHTQITEPLNLFLGLTQKEQTTENCIETASGLENTLRISERTTLTGSHEFKQLDLPVTLHTEETENAVNPLRNLTMTDHTSDASAHQINIGFDFSGFAP